MTVCFMRRESLPLISASTFSFSQSLFYLYTVCNFTVLVDSAISSALFASAADSCFQQKHPDKLDTTCPVPNGRRNNQLAESESGFQCYRAGSLLTGVHLT